MPNRFGHWSWAVALGGLLCISYRTPAQESKAAPAVQEVEADGYARGDISNARDQALADALRNAVQKGAGIDLISRTEVRDFVLEYDRVFVSSFGFVSAYQVLSSGLNQLDGRYHVKVRASVGAGNLPQNDELALLQLIQRVRMPRVKLEVAELIEGVSAGSEYTKIWLEEAMLKMRMNLLDSKRVRFNADNEQAWASFSGDQKAAKTRAVSEKVPSDLIIQARVHLRHLGQAKASITGELYHKFSLVDAQLRVVRSDTGLLLASFALPVSEPISGQEAKETAAREVVGKVLSRGSLTQDYPGAWKMFRILFAKWIAELDLGKLITVEFFNIGFEEWEAVSQSLSSKATGISSVFEREYRRGGFSVLDVETRLDMKAVNRAILGVAKSVEPDVLNPHFLRYKPKIKN